jgi:3-hydroxy-9,10-secoandrosta-1,3,5(10)-triene-9,17-dione monooxygenase reductase component
VLALGNHDAAGSGASNQDNAMSESAFDGHEFRSALGRFGTGVTVVTTRGMDGTPLGLTVSSFNSVSLAPPLVLWSLDRSSTTLEAFEAASHFAVNVLGADQIEISNRFAGRAEDKFADLECPDGAGDAPLLPGCVACFQCRTVHRYDGGDHVIFVGEVEAFEHTPGAALLFHDGSYCVAAKHPEGG